MKKNLYPLFPPQGAHYFCIRQKLSGSKGYFLVLCLSMLVLLSACSFGGDKPQSRQGNTVVTDLTPTPTVSGHSVPILGMPTPTFTPTPSPTPTVVGMTPVPTVEGTNSSGGPGNGNSSGSGTSNPTIAQAIFQAINQSRAAAGLAPLQWNAALQRSAHQHNLAMEAAQQMSHQLPGEPDLGARETAQGIQWSWAAENIGYTSQINTTGALGLHQAMMNEQPPDDGHRQNILTATGTQLGVDILIDTQHNRLWLTEDFAKT